MHLEEGPGQLTQGRAGVELMLLEYHVTKTSGNNLKMNKNKKTGSMQS
jgi:hypothetical protein